jgi:hypothetical protein
MNRIKIISDGTPMGTHTFIDGVELTNVTQLAVEVGVEGHMIATVTTKMYVDEIAVDGAVEVRHRAEGALE